MFHESKLSLGILALKNNNDLILKTYITEFPESPLINTAVNYLLSFYKENQLHNEELYYYNYYLEKFSTDPWFLNQFAWRMTELEINLAVALDKINLSLSLIDINDTNKAMVLDTKAEVLWKMGFYKDAVIIIDESIEIDPSNEYYKNQKNKFLQSIN